VLSGHLHRVERVGDAPPILLAGSTLSHRTKGQKNGWVLVEITGRTVRSTLRIAEGNTWRAAEPAEV
jgi:hypothetical protein